jgi:hypothetical protein
MDVRNGATAWKLNVGNIVRMTPALADGLLFVATYGHRGSKTVAPPAHRRNDAVVVRRQGWLLRLVIRRSAPTR